MDDDADPLAANRANWEERAAHHPDTAHYDIDAFLDGESSLYPLEREELGDAVGLGTSLLHLQCHLGTDTLSWAREGAEVVGVDFSPEALEFARDLAAETGLADRAEFVEADVLDLDREFDVVFTTYGVLFWLPDIEAWADTVARHLADGGTFYIAELHPFTGMLENVSDGAAEFAHPYFHEDEPLRFDIDGSYADEDAEFEATTTYEWAHGLGEIVTALCEAGLRIEFLHEHPWAEFRMWEALEVDEEGRWWLPEDDETPDLPLTFSIRARKE